MGFQKASLCSRTKLRALQVKLFGLKWSEGQNSVAAFGKRLRSAILALHAPMADEILLKRFKVGLSARLRDQAMLGTGDFGTVVSKLSRLSPARQPFFEKGARERQQPRADGSGSQLERMGPEHPDMKFQYCQKNEPLAQYCRQ